jgi:hypothetical protein
MSRRMDQNVKVDLLYLQMSNYAQKLLGFGAVCVHRQGACHFHAVQHSRIFCRGIIGILMFHLVWSGESRLPSIVVLVRRLTWCRGLPKAVRRVPVGGCRRTVRYRRKKAVDCVLSTAFSSSFTVSSNSLYKQTRNILRHVSQNEKQEHRSRTEVVVVGHGICTRTRLG